MSKQATPGLSLKEGHFGFAGHNDPVAFRNIAVGIVLINSCNLLIK